MTPQCHVGLDGVSWNKERTFDKNEGSLNKGWALVNNNTVSLIVANVLY